MAAPMAPGTPIARYWSRSRITRLISFGNSVPIDATCCSSLPLCRCGARLYDVPLADQHPAFGVLEADPLAAVLMDRQHHASLFGVLVQRDRQAHDDGLADAAQLFQALVLA